MPLRRVRRQTNGLALIESENFVRGRTSGDGHGFTNKYAEATRASVITAVRVCGRGGAGRDRSGEGDLWAEHANVQPHSGAQAIWLC